MKKIVFLVFVAVVSLVASEHGGETDIIPRSVDFLIFIGLLYYLLSNPIKDFFGSRQDSIVSDLNSVEEKIKLAKKAKDEALKKVEDAKILAKEIMEDTKKEVELLQERIKNSSANEVELIEKQKEEVKVVAKNKMIREVIAKSLDEILDVEQAVQDKNELTKALLKKVA
jgi:F-type H+-transporting ATPase subunit b